MIRFLEATREGLESNVQLIVGQNQLTSMGISSTYLVLLSVAVNKMQVAPFYGIKAGPINAQRSV